MNGPKTARRRRDDGFTLLESIITISLITVIMTALASFFMTAIASTTEQRARQLAVQLADTAMERLRAVNSADVLTANGASARTQFDPAPASVGPWLQAMTPAAQIGPTGRSLNGMQYSTATYLGAVTVDGVSYVRAVVAVTWADRRCSNATCAYLTATLISNAVDPTFNLNATPPASPMLSNPCGQTSVAGDSVNYALTVVSGTGVPPFTWVQASGTLPAGLGVTSAGAITGTIDPAARGNYTAGIQVTDAFSRTSDPADCIWHVNPPVSLTTALPDRSDAIGTAIVPVSLAATGGIGSGYTFSASGLPTGLQLVNGVISGTPTAPGSYVTTVIATDSSGHSGQTRFTWTISYPPLKPTTPGPQTSTLNTAIPPYQMQARGGSNNYSWTDPSGSLPAGLSLTPGGLITGTPTSLGARQVTLTVTDAAAQATSSVTFSWTVVSTPAVTAPPAQTTTTGASVNLQLTSSCPNAPCSYKLANGPTGLTISTTGVITGQISSPAQNFPSTTVTVTDAAGATAASAPLRWTVNPKPAMASPGDQVADAGQPDSLSLAGLAGGGTAPYTYSASGLPSWLKLDPATGQITGTAPTTTGVTANITVAVTDASQVSATSAPFRWTVNPALTLVNPGNQVVDVGRSDSLSLAGLVGGGTSPYTYSATGLPSWLKLDPATGQITGTAPTTTSVTANITVSVNDTAGSVITSAPFSWTVTPLPAWSAPVSVTTRWLRAASVQLGSYVTGGSAPFSFSATGLPAGLSLDTKTGLITGTPYIPGNYTVPVTVTDSSGASASTQISWSVQ